MQPTRMLMIVGVAVGLALIGLGFAARELALEPDESYEERVDQWLERADGTVIIYDYQEFEGEAWGVHYEIVSLDDATSLVYLVDPQLDARFEVFRGDRAEAVQIHGSDEVDAHLDAELVDGRTVAVYRIDEQREVAVEVFRGTTDEAALWWDEHFDEAEVIEGTRAEAEAWIDAEREAPRDVFMADVVIATGVVSILAGLALAWPRLSSLVSFVVIGAAVGLVPGAVLRLVVEITEQAATEHGGTAGSVAFMGAIVGGALGFVFGQRETRDEPTPIPDSSR